MANFIVCYSFMMDNEDRQRGCASVPDPAINVPDARAISGINSAAFPAQFAAIVAIPQSNRAPAVMQFYRTVLWNHWLESLVSDEVGKRVFDTLVNIGSKKACLILQQALNAVGAYVEEDGAWGPVTLAAANGSDALKLVQAFKVARAEHYRQFDADNPNLPGLLTRAAL